MFQHFGHILCTAVDEFVDIFCYQRTQTIPPLENKKNTKLIFIMRNFVEKNQIPISNYAKTTH